MPGVPWHTQILADQVTLFQPGGTNYAHLITIGTPGFSDLPTALNSGLMPILIKKSSTDSTIGVLFLYIFEVTDVKKFFAICNFLLYVILTMSLWHYQLISYLSLFNQVTMGSDFP